MSAPSSDIPQALCISGTGEPTFKVYKPPNRSTDAFPDLPDSYFSPTSSELKSAQTQLSARTRALVNAPLQLRATREAKERSKRDKWPLSTIRVRFSDRTQIEKTFPSTNPISFVYAFIRSSLREDVKSVKFTLYQSPPKRDFNMLDLTLAELHLAPSSIILLRFEEDSLNASDNPAPLAPSILSQAVDLPPSISHLESNSHPSPSLTSTPTARSKVPKWFKGSTKS